MPEYPCPEMRKIEILHIEFPIIATEACGEQYRDCSRLWYLDTPHPFEIKHNLQYHIFFQSLIYKLWEK